MDLRSEITQPNVHPVPDSGVAVSVRGRGRGRDRGQGRGKGKIVGPVLNPKPISEFDPIVSSLNARRVVDDVVDDISKGLGVDKVKETCVDKYLGDKGNDSGVDKDLGVEKVNQSGVDISKELGGDNVKESVFGKESAFEKFKHALTESPVLRCGTEKISKALVKPNPKVAIKPNPKAAVKPNPKAVVKPKAVKPNPKRKAAVMDTGSDEGDGQSVKQKKSKDILKRKMEDINDVNEDAIKLLLWRLRLSNSEDSDKGTKKV